MGWGVDQLVSGQGLIFNRGEAHPKTMLKAYCYQLERIKGDHFLYYSFTSQPKETLKSRLNF